ncbi:TnpV protein [Clostridium tarantellae]|uniref:TnpV protein n=1 Tax=Clostridium tarantellae TaxID=39493 RepID=UPI0014794832
MKQHQNWNYIEKDGILYPEIQISNEEKYDKMLLGKYGQAAFAYMKEYHPVRFNILVGTGELMKVVHQVDERAYQMVERLTEEMLEKDPIEDPYDFMESYRKRLQMRMVAEEIVLKEIVYQVH